VTDCFIAPYKYSYLLTYKNSDVILLRDINQVDVIYNVDEIYRRTSFGCFSNYGFAVLKVGEFSTVHGMSFQCAM